MLPAQHADNHFRDWNTVGSGATGTEHMPTILVVDDDAIQRELTSYALEHHGYTSVCAVNGKQAWALLQSQPVDLILLDTMMPELDGPGFLRLMRRDPRYANVPVIMLTAREDLKEIRETAKLGVKDYLLKSQCTVDVLLDRVRKRTGNGFSAIAWTKDPKQAPTCAVLAAPAPDAGWTDLPGSPDQSPLSEQLLAEIIGRDRISLKDSRGQRESQRLAFPAEVAVIPVRQARATAKIENISTRNIGLILSDPMREGDEFLVELRRGNAASVWMRCVVKRWQPVGEKLFLIGARFIASVAAPPVAA